jgi:predicted O-methyltransferase YrrM
MIISSLGLKNVCLDTNKPMVGLEIGVYRGDNAVWLLNTFPNLTLHGVDPYEPYNDWNGAINCSDQDLQEGKRADIIAKERLSIFEQQGRYIHYKKTSDDAVNNFTDAQFDFVFIDGLHEYDQVLQDCKNYYSKVKVGGIFAGHDYMTISGVHNAVNEFAASVSVTVSTMPTDSWFWIKQ